MLMTCDQLEIEALKLDNLERARLAERLIASLAPDPEVEEAWNAEIIRRCHEIDSGTAELVPAAEVFAEIRSKLK